MEEQPKKPAAASKRQKLDGTNPLALLQVLSSERRLDEAREEGGNILLGTMAWKREVKTNFKIRG
jgi:hypothetical protein